MLDVPYTHAPVAAAARNAGGGQRQVGWLPGQRGDPLFVAFEQRHRGVSWKPPGHSTQLSMAETSRGRGTSNSGAVRALSSACTVARATINTAEALSARRYIFVIGLAPKPSVALLPGQDWEDGRQQAPEPGCQMRTSESMPPLPRYWPSGDQATTCTQLQRGQANKLISPRYGADWEGGCLATISRLQHVGAQPKSHRRILWL